MMKYDCVIIGAGIAGMTAAMYLQRANVKTLLIEKDTPGGVLQRVRKIANYPGVPNTDGVSLAMAVYEQIKALQVNYYYGSVQEIKLSNGQKHIITDKETIVAPTIIIASGKQPPKRALHLPNEEKLQGRGISWCATCDGFKYKGEVVAVVGSDNIAFEETLYLANIAKEVYVLYDSRKLAVEEELIAKVKERTNIKLMPDLQIARLEEQAGYLVGLQLSDGQQIALAGLFVATTAKPMLDYLDKLAVEHVNGYLEVNQQMQTSITGIYACGDAINKDVYQLTTAVGEAAIAANAVKKQLDMT